MMYRKGERLHLYLSSTILFIGFMLLIALYAKDPVAIQPTAMFIAERPVCEDFTPIGECSYESLGNKCVLSKRGPNLEFSPDCYD